MQLDPYTFDFGQDGGDPTPPPVDAAVFGGETYYNYFAPASQSPTTATPADTSWTGLNGLPQVARDALSVVQTGFGLSLAKDQIMANRDITKAQLNATIARANSDALISRYQGAAQVSAAQRAAMYPNGLPFGTSRSDQIMIAIGVAGLFLAYLQAKK